MRWRLWVDGPHAGRLRQGRWLFHIEAHGRYRMVSGRSKGYRTQAGAVGALKYFAEIVGRNPLQPDIPVSFERWIDDG